MNAGFGLAVLAVAVIAGATASVTGFGIGSLLTPLLAARFGTAAAVAAVAIPHAVATAVRAWRLRRAVEWDVVRRFGSVSAAGGLAGGLLYTRLGTVALTAVLGLLLVATALAGLTGWASRWRPRGPAVGMLGLASGFFGGVAGNQGGLRAAALLAFRLPPATYVATSTLTALLVDAARTPIYVWQAGSALQSLAGWIAVAVAGVLAGTLLGERILLGLSPERFRLVVSAVIGLLGIWLIGLAVRPVILLGA